MSAYARFEKHRITGPCPHLGFDTDAASRGYFVTDHHRCYARRTAGKIDAAHQAAYCLGAFLACPVPLLREQPAPPAPAVPRLLWVRQRAWLAVLAALVVAVGVDRLALASLPASLLATTVLAASLAALAIGLLVLALAAGRATPRRQSGEMVHSPSGAVGGAPPAAKAAGSPDEAPRTAISALPLGQRG